MEIDAQTLVLIDNSLSVSKPNREITKATLKYLFSHSEEGRAYCFAPFSHTLDYAESYTVDYIGLEDMAERLEYENKEASITDVLCEILNKWEESDFACRDIVILTDGLEEESENYEREELFYLLEHSSYPVYIVCLDQEDNEAAAKNLSAIATVSGGELFHTEFEDSEAEIEKKLTEKIQGRMRQYRQENWEVYDNEEEAATDEEESGESSDGTENEQITDVINEEETLDDVLAGTAQTDSVIYEEQNDNAGLSPVSFAVFGTALFLAVCGVFLSWCLFLRHRHKVKKEEDEYRNRIMTMAKQSRDDALSPPVQKNMKSRYRDMEKHEDDDFRIGRTVSILRRDMDNGTDNATRLLSEEDSDTDISFEDAADPSRYYKISSRGSLVLGRLASCCDLAFDYDDSVSGKHAQMYKRDERWYIKDAGSSNGTFINGEKVYTEAEIRTGDMLKMGSLSLIVRF